MTGGTCRIQVTTTGAGTAVIQASYQPDNNNNLASGPVQTLVTVSQAQSSTAVICNPSTLVVGQTTQCTASISGGYNPTGSITWSTSGTGNFQSNPCTLSLGSCSVTYTPTSSGTLTAAYSGDPNNLASTGTFTIVANVNQLIQISVANGAPVPTLSLSGCSVSVTSMTANGAPVNVTATAGCSPITVTLPPAQGGARYETSSGEDTLEVGSCSTVPCQTYSATIYYQLQNTYQASPQSPSTWSSPGSITVTGTALGTSGETICTISVTTGSSQFPCEGWADFDTPVTMGILQISPNQRWATSQNSFTDTTGGNAHTSSYYSQVLEGFEYVLVGSTTAPSAPRLNYTSFGGLNAASLTGTASSVWVDSGSTWSVPSTLQGSTSSERWESQVSSGAATAGQTVMLTYYHQFDVSFAYEIDGGGTAYTDPTISFTAFGALSGGSSGWVDAGSSYTYTNPLSGSTSAERWLSPKNAGVVSEAETVTETYYHQFAFALNFTVSGGGIYSNPRLTYTALAVSSLEQVNSTQTVFWIDSGASWSISPLLPSSSASEQWITVQKTSGTATAPLEAEFLYHHQYLTTVHYTILGTGGAEPVPKLNYTSLGTSIASPLNKTASSLWMDAGAKWSVPLVLPGVHGERWLSNVTGAVLVSEPLKVDAQYSHQFYFEAAVATTGGGEVWNTDQWTDQGSSIILNATAQKLWSFAYWAGATAFSYNGTTRLTSLTVQGPANETAIFFPGLTIFSGPQGAIGYSYGSINGSIPANTNSTIYPPPGKEVVLTALPNAVSIMFLGWAGDLSGAHIQNSIAITTPSVVRGAFTTDYADIRTFVLATIFVFVAACYVFIINRGFTPKVIPLLRRGQGS